MYIARFSYLKAIPLMIFVLALAVWPWIALLTPVGEAVHNKYGKAIAHDGSTWILLVLSFLLLPSLAAWALGWIRGKGKAVWIEKGNLRYMPMHVYSIFAFFRSVPLAEIDSFSVGSMRLRYGYMNGIVVKMKNGRDDELPTHVLAESRTVVLHRLNEALAASR